jgi:hypothetical protein
MASSRSSRWLRDRRGTRRGAGLQSAASQCFCRSRVYVYLMLWLGNISDFASRYLIPASIATQAIPQPRSSDWEIRLIFLSTPWRVHDCSVRVGTPSAPLFEGGARSPPAAPCGCALGACLRVRHSGLAVRVRPGTPWRERLGRDDRSACGRCSLRRRGGRSKKMPSRSGPRSLAARLRVPWAVECARECPG